MNKYLIMAACALLCACQKIDFAELEQTETEQANVCNVQFVMNGLQVDYTRATLTSEGMTDLWVYEGTELLKHQVSTDSDFGAPTISLKIGAHDLTFVASKAQGQTFSDHWKCVKVADTFGAVVAYTVTSTSKSKQVQLSRVNGRVGWTVEDAVLDDASSMTLKITNQCYGLDADLNGTDAAVYETNADISGKVGMTGFAPGVNVLPARHADGNEVKAYFKITSESETLCEYEHTVTVKANEEVNIHGKFFGGSMPASVSLNTAWGQVTNVDVK